MLGRGRAQTAGMGQPGTEQIQAPNSAQAAESIGWANANDSSKNGPNVFPQASKVALTDCNFQAAQLQNFNHGRNQHIQINIGRAMDNGASDYPPENAPQVNQNADTQDPRPGFQPQKGSTVDANTRGGETNWKTQGGSAKKSSDIYYQHIGVQRRGSPLWIPEPSANLSEEYRRGGIAIGDVGIITEFGTFDFLFNIRLPRDHLINLSKPGSPPDLPEGFEVLDIAPKDILRYREFGPGSFLCSTSIQKQQPREQSDFTFTSNSSEGAILMMPVGTQSEDVVNIRHVRQFIAKHAEDWYRYTLKTRGREAKNGDLRLVIGYDKTTAWGMATFSNSTSQTLRFMSAEDTKSGTPRTTYCWEASGSAQLRVFPDSYQVESPSVEDHARRPSRHQNQTLFVRTMNITLQQRVWDSLLAETGDANVRNTPTGTNPHGQLPHAYHTQYFPTSTPVLVASRFNALDIHPSNAINNKLLKEHPRSKMVVTNDNDWTSLLEKDDYILPTSDEMVDRLRKRQQRQTSLAQSEGGVTFLAESSGEKQSPGNRCDNRTRGDDSTKTQNVPVILKTPVLEDTDDGRLKDIAILVIGPTGAGKSTFINTLLSKDSEERMVVNGSLTSSVAAPKAAEIRSFSSHPQVRGRRLYLIDTPGFDDTRQEDVKILERIGNYLTSVDLKDKVLSGVIYLHDITSDRFSTAGGQSLGILERLTGELALKNVVLGTTKWSRETKEKHCKLHESELRDKYWKPLIFRGSVMLRFEDSSESATRFVETILGRTTDHGIVLNVDKELANQKKKGVEKETAKRKEGLFRRIRKFFAFGSKVSSLSGSYFLSAPTNVSK